jgi:hypothetical protein
MTTRHPQLGPQLGYYQGLPVEAKIRLAALLYGMWIGVLALMGGFLLFLDLWQPALVMLLGMGVPAWMWWRACREARKATPQQIWLYQEGMVAHTGPSQIAFHWDRVVEVYHLAYAITSGKTVVKETHMLRLRVDGESTVILNEDLMNAGKAAAEITSSVTRARFPMAVRALDAGVHIPFGPFTVTPEGITREESLSWARIGSVKVSDGELTMTDSTGVTWSRAPLFQVPNIDLLIKLVAHRKGLPA